MSLDLDPMVLLLAPVLLAAVVGLLAFVGCDLIFTLDDPTEPIAFVQKLADLPQTDPVASLTAPFLGSVTPGNLIVVWVWFHTSSGATIDSVTDSIGSHYDPADDLVLGANQTALATVRQQVWYAKKAGAGAENTPGTGTLTVNFVGAVDANLGVSAFEYKNASTEPLVRASHGTGSGAQAESPVTPTSDARMLFGTVVFAIAGTNDPEASQRIIQEGNVAEDYLAAPLPQRIRANTGPNGPEEDWMAQLVAFR